MRDRFLIYTKYRRQIAALANEQKGVLFDAILAYMSGESLPGMDLLTGYAFNVIQADLDADTAKYEARCKANAENVRKRWAAEDTNVYDRIRTHTNDTDMIRYDKIEDLKRKNNKKEKAARKNAFNNFHERPYDFADLEKQLKEN